MKFLALFIFMISLPVLANAEDSYCTRLAAKGFEECKQNNAGSEEDLKTCPGVRTDMRKSCYTQLATLKSQVGFLSFMNSEKYSHASDEVINSLENTELSEEALNRTIAENDLNDEVYAELSRLTCVDKKADGQENTYCPLAPQDESPINTDAITSTDYLISIYNIVTSNADNPIYTLFMMHQGKLYALGDYDSPALNTKKRILRTLSKTEGQDVGTVNFYKIDTGKHGLTLLKTFTTTQFGNGIINEDQLPDNPGGYLKRASEYNNKMKFNLPLPEFNQGK